MNALCTPRDAAAQRRKVLLEVFLVKRAHDRFQFVDKQKLFGRVVLRPVPQEVNLSGRGSESGYKVRLIEGVGDVWYNGSGDKVEVCIVAKCVSSLCCGQCRAKCIQDRASERVSASE